MHISDVVVQSLVSDIFWLAILIIAIAAFRHEIRNVLNSLGSFKVAGASFELKDSRTTIENYVILTNIMIEALTERNSAIKLGQLLSPLSVRQLVRFAIKYAQDVPEDAKQVELLANIALILGQRDDTESATLFFDAILKTRPHDLDILTLKANALGESNSPVLLAEAERIQDGLVLARPKNAMHRFNRAITRARLAKYDDAIADLESTVDLEYWKFDRSMLISADFRPLAAMPRFQQLEARVKTLLQTQP